MTRDALIARQYALSGGFTSPQIDNIGEIRSHGVELGLRGFVVNSPDLSVDLFANAAYLQQKVTDLGGAPPIKLGYFRYGNWIMEGYAPGAFFGPKLVDARYPIDQNGDGRPDSEEELLAYFSSRVIRAWCGSSWPTTMATVIFSTTTSASRHPTGPVPSAGP